jgi:hypothetical protein
MGEVLQFVPKSELERARLMSEARAIYESIFPTLEGGTCPAGVGKLHPKQDGRSGPATA